MNKAEIITALRAQMQEELDTLMRGKGLDQDPERVQTRIEELKKQLAADQEVTDPAEIIEIGSLVTYEEVGKQFFVLILPGCKGDMLTTEAGHKIACVSPDSGIAEGLIGHKAGETVEVKTGKITRKLKIADIG